MLELKQDPEKALLVGIYDRDAYVAEDSLDELADLAQANGIHVVGRALQHRKNPDGAHYVGKGKVEEIKGMIEANCASIIIFDNELRSSQVRNLSKILKVRVIDRSELILDIFASRARTKQAKLQVEVAQLKYEMSRLRKLWTHFGKLAGGIGGRGMGETQLEVDRRRTRARVHMLEKELKHLLEQKSVETKNRDEVYKVALVGYTNAGKSTLINQLTDSEVFAEDLLFATLDTTTRRVKLDKHTSFILSDTVGFVSKLPHHLVASFHATLAEVQDADLLLHVIDISNTAFEAHVDTVMETLGDIGCGDKKMLYVFNKTDKITSAQGLDDRLEEKYGKNFVFISAKGGMGIEKLNDVLRSHIDKNVIKADVAIPWSNGKALAYVQAHSKVLSTMDLEDKQVLSLKISKDDFSKLQRLLKSERGRS